MGKTKEPKREELHLSEREIRTIISDYYEEENNEFEFIKEDITYHDGEKGISTIEYIIQRNSDGKYFRGEYQRGSAGSRWYDEDLYEVFPKQITVTVYE